MARTREYRLTEKKTCSSSSSVFSPQWSLWPLPLSRSLRGLLLLIIFLMKPKWILDSGQDERSAAEHHRQRAVSWSKPILSQDPALCCFDTVAAQRSIELGWMTKFNHDFHHFFSAFSSKTGHCAHSTPALMSPPSFLYSSVLNSCFCKSCRIAPGCLSQNSMQIIFSFFRLNLVIYLESDLRPRIWTIMQPLCV